MGKSPFMFVMQPKFQVTMLRVLTAQRFRITMSHDSHGAILFPRLWDNVQDFILSKEIS